MPDQIISQEGYDKLKQELDYLTNVKRREIADRIEHAKELGDLSENAEYHDSKEAQAFNEGRIAEISAMLKNLTVVACDHGCNIIGMGSKIVVSSNGKEKVYTIVSFNEADPLEGRISNESPMGRAFIGHIKGEKIIVETPRGPLECKILKVE